MWHITALGVEHAHSLAECHITCWRAAHREIVPAHVLAAFDLEQRAAAWQRTLAGNADPVHGVLVDDQVIGFACAGPTRDPDAPTPRELYAIYLRDTYHGSGLADQLIEAAVAPTTPCSLWVFERNPRAQSFYRKHGFTLDGTRKPEPFSAGAIEVRMTRTVPRPSDLLPE